ncbi:MAG: DUF5320 domain-containing protein [Deltaproteobacteria bacterium]|nr:DUF5320 domain-containing protein [Deltaproteobacteria bacterium]
MPGGDRTGPMGAGPMTGRAAGPCAGNQATDNSYPAGRFGWGFGRGRGGGQGRGMGFRGGRGGGRGQGMGFRGGYGGGWGGPYAWEYPGSFGGPAPSIDVANKDIELDMLKQHASQMEATLNNIRKRMDELEQDQSEKE